MMAQSHPKPWNALFRRSRRSSGISYELVTLVYHSSSCASFGRHLIRDSIVYSTAEAATEDEDGSTYCILLRKHEDHFCFESDRVYRPQSPSLVSCPLFRPYLRHSKPIDTACKTSRRSSCSMAHRPYTVGGSVSCETDDLESELVIDISC